MRKIFLLILATLGTAYAAEPVGALNTRDVGLDQLGVCWHRGPANVLTTCGGTGSGIAVTAITVLPTAGYWLVIPALGTPSLVNANGTTTAAGAVGTAYPVISP